MHSIFFIPLLVMLSCSIPSLTESEPEETSIPFLAKYNMTELEFTETYDAQQDLGELENRDMNEISGIVTGRLNPHIIWSHNDSGDDSRIFATRKNGDFLGTIILEGADNRDWEDIAIGPGPIEGDNYIYVAEIGDNNARYPIKRIYRFSEPSVQSFSGDDNTLVLSEDEFDVITFVYPEDIKTDAETLLVDPLTKNIFIVTKREYPVTVYKLAFPQNTNDTLVASKYGNIPFMLAVGGDFSPDGSKLLIKTYEVIYLWERDGNESPADMWMREPVQVPYEREPQGEAIGFNADGTGFYTISEKRNGVEPVVYFYPEKSE
jgi:hypothetical protein